MTRTSIIGELRDTIYDDSDLEPTVALVLERMARNLSPQPYLPKSEAEIQPALERYLAAQKVHAEVMNVARLGGGGSKEQFVFDLRRSGIGVTRHVLRIDPAQSPIETNRRREFEILRAMKGVVPVPDVQWLDAEGSVFGQPAIIMSFIQGVTKPVGKPTGNVSGLGIVFGDALRKKIADQVLDQLVAIHAMDWRSADIPSFQAPIADRYQAARWHVNWWSRVWRLDRVQPMPLMALVERWLVDNVPACEDPVVVHGDYRSGNFIFDNTTSRVTAILDWELAHLGDYHQDLAYLLLSPLGTRENGVSYATGLFEYDWFIREYSERSGRVIDPVTLHFYKILNCYMSVVIALGSCVRSARDSQSHQDTHLTWVAAVGHVLHTEMCDLIEKGPDNEPVS